MLQSLGLQRVGHDLVTKQQQQCIPSQFWIVDVQNEAVSRAT